jgi:FAD/FMN-containing dehydrogenase
MIAKKRKRATLTVLASALLFVASLLAPVNMHLASMAYAQANDPDGAPSVYVDDASRLNRTKVAGVREIPVDGKGPEQQLATLLAKARTQGLPVSVAGARHSMGGHTIYPGGIAISMLPWNGMELDAERNIVKVQAGALWKDIIAYLDRRGRSVAVMQSNNSFSVGGSISVNCHGWQYGRPPIASTVESFRLMKADGSIVRCSRSEQRELFSLVLGGYGLLGVILDVELRTVPNERYRLEQFIVPIDEALATFDSKIKDKPGVEMVYARMNITAKRLLDDVIINAFVRDPGPIPPLSDPGNVVLRRAIFRGSAASEYGKQLRWHAETKLQPALVGTYFSRNQLLNEGVEVFENRTPDSTDILHEYFVPRARARQFVAAMRSIIAKRRANLLNVTVRSVSEDPDTFLRYADQPMIAFVMLFVQQRTDAAEKEMETLTRELIDAALEHDGRYYLPYRLHATTEQFHQAYAKAREFFDLKRKYDPGELFQNQFYLKYGRVASR